ncbi:MAG: 3-deoxy-7-phosphoheptulonate synthase class II [Bacteroidota bacterium]
MLPTTLDWSPTSWTARPALQQPTYPDGDTLDAVTAELATYPPLVTSWEIVRLKQYLAEAAVGSRFVLQGGDCAERFDECTPRILANRLKILLQMSLVLIHGLRKPVVRVGRIAGQYAKPRSADLETRDGQRLPSYRGDIINGAAFTPEARTPDPQRMLDAYHRSAMTLNFMRALVEGGFADLHHPEFWNLTFAQDSPLAEEFHRRVFSIRETLQFIQSVTGGTQRELREVELFTSHEALLLPYEASQTRTVPRRDGYYNLATHFPWIGMRTAGLGGAHVEYMRGLRNPIAVKVGPAMSPAELQALVRHLDPNNEPGHLTLITRFGARRVADLLPPLIDAVRATGHRVLWIADPMHGNTETTASGIKTRHFDNILGELETAFDVHRTEGSHLGGVHFELTGEDVTECLGGTSNLMPDDLERAYTSQVDPRLNYEQALEMALRIVRRAD